MRIPVVTMEVFSSVPNIPYAHSTIPISIDTFNNLKVQYGIEKQKDTISFSIPYTGEDVFDTLKINDMIKVYARYHDETVTKEESLLLTGYIKSYDYSANAAKGTINFQCANKSEILLNSFIFAPYNEANTTAAQKIVDSCNRLALYSTMNKVYAFMDYSGGTTPGPRGCYDATGTIIEDTASTEDIYWQDKDNNERRYGYVRAYKKEAYNDNGTLKAELASNVPEEYIDGKLKYFQSLVPFVETYKPFIESLEVISKPEQTGESDDVGSYMFFIDEYNNLHWMPKNLNNVDIKTGDTLAIEEGQTTQYKLTYNTDEVINSVVLNGGEIDNVGIEVRSFNLSSIGRNGSKWKYVPKVSIAENLKSLEVASGQYTDREDEGENSPFYITGSGFPSDYPWKVQSTVKEINMVKGEIYDTVLYTAGDIVNSRTEYFKYFKAAVEYHAFMQAKKITNEEGFPLITMDLTLEQGTMRITPGSMLEIEIPTFTVLKTLKAKLMVEKVDHNFTGGKWVTKLTLKEQLEERVDKNE